MWAFWIIVVLPECHGLLTVHILKQSTPRILWFVNCGHSEKQNTQNPMVCDPHLEVLYNKVQFILEKIPPSKKEQNRQNQLIMIEKV